MTLGRKYWKLSKILASLTDHPNSQDEEGKTSIHWAAYDSNEETEIVKSWPHCQAILML